ncbi:MAG: DltE protein [Bryobacterales bacterium]|jgi:uncharacterized oxidoreductase|nr:DltE protein [Bryobacterales bacterium]
MDMTGNSILITGGGSGIGRGLAEAFHQLGNRVVIAGRRQEALDSVTTANPGISALTVDMADAASIAAFAQQLERHAPELNVVINNAGIMRPEDLLSGDASTAEAIIATNLLGPIRLTAALLPLLRRQRSSTIMMVSSGLAFVPMALTATYCATKAAIHSYSQSLRYQLRDTTISVVELIPPYVGTELMPGGTVNPRAMPLDEFITEVMNLLTTPGAEEVCVERVKPLRFAAQSGHFDEIFNGLNAAMPH